MLAASSVVSLTHYSQTSRQRFANVPRVASHERGTPVETVF